MVDIIVNGGIPSAPTKTSMIDFNSLYSKYGDLAKSSRFLVMVQPPPAVLKTDNGDSFPIEDLIYLCESAELPGRGFMSSDIRYYGPNFKVPYQSTYEDINLTFLCRDQFIERNFFDNWMSVINPVNSYDFAYRNTYLSTIYIWQMSDVDLKSSQSTQSDSGQSRYLFALEKAYPILVNPQPVTWADDNFHRITVTFSYTRWYRPNLEKIVNDDGGSLIKDGSQVVTNNGTTLPYVL